MLRDDPKLSTDLRPELPSELKRLIMRCLRKDVARRFQNVVDLKVALEELKEESESMRIASGPAGVAQRKSNSRVWMGVAALVVVGVLAIAGWRQWNREAAPVAAMAVTPLTSYAGAESDPSFSPDGNQIAFAWSGEKDDNSDIYVKVIGPDPPLRLTTSPDFDSDPAWSPDGRSIAFCRSNVGRRGEIILMPALGGAERNLGRVVINTFDHPLEWSKDGKWLFLPRRMEGQVGVGIVMLSPTTGEVKALTRPATKVSIHGSPRISPDGRTLAYLSSESGGIGTSKILLQGLSESLAFKGEPRQVGGSDASISGVIWTHEGRELLYWAGNVTSRSGLFRVVLDSKAQPEAVALPGRNVRTASYSEQSKRLVYSEYSLNTNLFRIELTNQGKPAEKLISSTMREAFPQYLPDGKKIVFYSN